MEEYKSPKELDDRILDTAKRRLAHGYHITALKGPRHYKVLAQVEEMMKKKNEHCPAPTLS